MSANKENLTLTNDSLVSTIMSKNDLIFYM
jgi:hypothetical protein